MEDPSKKKLLGWDVTFEIPKLELKFGVDEIQQVSLGMDVNSGIPMVKIILKLDTSLSDEILKTHVGTLTIVNKGFLEDTPQEIYKIELQSYNQMGRYVRREANDKEERIIHSIFPICYYCKNCAVLNQIKVGGIYDNMNLESIIKDLYNQTKCDIPLKLTPPDNKTKYESIFIPQSNFTSIIKHLSYTYGIYNSQLLMFGNTFVQDEPKEYVISSVNGIKGEELKFHNIPDKDESTEYKSINEKEYYTYAPIDIGNSISKIMQSVPQTLKCISFDNDTFIKKKEIKIKDVVSGIKFLKNSDQFQDDKNFQFKEMLVSCNREDNFQYSINDAVQRIATGAVQTNVMTIPNPFLMQHWKIGNIINYTSEHLEYIKSDVKLFVFGILYIWRQTQNGGAWDCSLQVRPGAASTIK